MTWFIYAALASLLFALSNILLRVLAVQAQNPRAFSFVFSSAGALSALLIFLISLPSITFSPISATTIGLTAIVTLLYGLYERIQFSARKHIQASTLSIIYRLSPVVTFIVAVLALRESFSAQKLLGLLIVVSANVLLLYKNQTIKWDKNLLIGIIAPVLSGLAAVFDKYISPAYPLSLYTLIIWAVPLIYIYLPNISHQDLTRELNQGWWKIFIAAAVNTLGFYAMIQAFALAEASRVIVVIAASTLIVVASGILFLKETEHLLRKLIAGTLVVLGIILIK